MKKEVLIFVFDGYTDYEPAYLCVELNDEKTDYKVKTVSFSLEPVTSMGGIHVIPDYTIDNYPKEFAALVLAGGYPWLEHKNDAVTPMVRYAIEHNIPVGAICSAATYMAQQGFLNTIKHTGNTLDFIKEYAPDYTGEHLFQELQVVQDGGIITANCTASLDFCKEISKMLNVKSDEEIMKEYYFEKNGMFKAV